MPMPNRINPSTKTEVKLVFSTLNPFCIDSITPSLSSTMANEANSAITCKAILPGITRHNSGQQMIPAKMATNPMMPTPILRPSILRKLLVPSAHACEKVTAPVDSARSIPPMSAPVEATPIKKIARAMIKPKHSNAMIAIGKAGLLRNSRS